MTWTYQVKNTGVVSIPKANVTVTDSIPGVSPVFQPGQGSDNGDNFLAPNEIWIYTAAGLVLDLGAPVPAGLQQDGSGPCRGVAECPEIDEPRAVGMAPVGHHPSGHAEPGGEATPLVAGCAKDEGRRRHLH